MGPREGPKWSRLVLVVENMLGIDILGGKFSGVIFTPQNKGICQKFKGKGYFETALGRYLGGVKKFKKYVLKQLDLPFLLLKGYKPIYLDMF